MGQDNKVNVTVMTNNTHGGWNDKSNDSGMHGTPNQDTMGQDHKPLQVGQRGLCSKVWSKLGYHVSSIHGCKVVKKLVQCGTWQNESASSGQNW